MRFTTKLSTLMTLLVVLAMVMMLLGSALGFYTILEKRMSQRFDAIVALVDQEITTSTISEQQPWLQLLAKQLGIVTLSVDKGTPGDELRLLTSPETSTLWDSYKGYNHVRLVLPQHPDLFLHITYIDPFITEIQSLRFSAAVAVPVLFMIVILLFSLRWLHRQTNGEYLLARRAEKILQGEREAIRQGDAREYPPQVSSALDRLLGDLANMRAERGRVDTQIRAFAAQDAKTGLNNRRFFDNQLITALEEEGAHGMVMMIQAPTLEQPVSSDAFSSQMAALVNLLSTFVARYPSALLARYFYSDFTLLLPHRSLKEAEMIAVQLITALDALPDSHQQDRDAFLHIGVTSYRPGQTASQVIDQAEQAARLAALQGGNGWYIYDHKVPEMGRGSVKWRTLLENMLQRGGPSLYQKIALNIDGSVHHREIMSKIHDGQQELLPAEYMPLVQQLGLSERYERLQINRILPLLALWPDETLAFPLSIPLLLQRNFRNWLRDKLLQCEKKQRRRILFELAEADVCQHIDHLRPALSLLLGLGCRLAVTQAGLTVVSTNYIKALQVDIVKLHPGLVRGIDEHIESQLFVQSLTGACEGTAAKVFATSVRTYNEWQTLKEKGIQGGQGDFFAPSQPVEG